AITEFHGPSVPRRRGVKERRQSHRIRPPVRRQLDQNRAERLLKSLGSPQESPEDRPGILEALHVRSVATELERVAEVGRDRLPPRVEGHGAGKAVEAAVDLHRVEMSSIVGKPLVARELLWIEDASPVTIVEARGADAKCRALHHKWPLTSPSGILSIARLVRIGLSLKLRHHPSMGCVDKEECWARKLAKACGSQGPVRLKAGNQARGLA